MTPTSPFPAARIWGRLSFNNEHGKGRLGQGGERKTFELETKLNKLYPLPRKKKKAQQTIKFNQEQCSGIHQFPGSHKKGSGPTAWFFPWTFKCNFNWNWSSTTDFKLILLPSVSCSRHPCFAKNPYIIRGGNRTLFPSLQILITYSFHQSTIAILHCINLFSVRHFIKYWELYH